LGANCTVVCGVKIGRYAFVGAGAVVLKDVPDFGLVVGNPGRLIGWMCACGHRLQFEDNGTTACSHCQNTYTKKNTEIVQNG
jgi:UDP-2-acetamido-3-amino-2,3-dideoxy-glucuronate N-acetyltransferase